jgi:hypothetical protein
LAFHELAATQIESPIESDAYALDEHLVSGLSRLGFRDISVRRTGVGQKKARRPLWETTVRRLRSTLEGSITDKRSESLLQQEGSRRVHE